MFCSQCGKENKDGSKFCKYCGATIPNQTIVKIFCSQCGKEVKAGNKFCKYCGSVIPNQSTNSSTSTPNNDPYYRNRKKRPILFTLVVILCFAIVCGSCFAYNHLVYHPDFKGTASLYSDYAGISSMTISTDDKTMNVIIGKITYTGTIKNKYRVSSTAYGSQDQIIYNLENIQEKGVDDPSIGLSVTVPVSAGSGSIRGLWGYCYTRLKSSNVKTEEYYVISYTMNIYNEGEGAFYSYSPTKTYVINSTDPYSVAETNLIYQTYESKYPNTFDNLIDKDQIDISIFDLKKMDEDVYDVIPEEEDPYNWLFKYELNHWSV